MITTEQIQKTKFVDGVFNPMEARQMITSVIDRQIHFYKLQYLRQWESNHCCDSNTCDSKIEELESRKNELLAIIDQSKAEGCDLSLDASFEVKMIKNW